MDVVWVCPGRVGAGGGHPWVAPLGALGKCLPRVWCGCLLAQPPGLRKAGTFPRGEWDVPTLALTMALSW